jgi:hypothetical protein
MGLYGQQMQQSNALLGGVLGLGAGLIKSDRRAKDDIDKIGTVFAANADGARRKLPVYEYSYKDDPSSTRHIGPMAQDVEKIAPEAVEEHRGVKYIRPREVMGSIIKAA